MPSAVLGNGDQDGQSPYPPGVYILAGGGRREDT